MFVADGALLQGLRLTGWSGLVLLPIGQPRASGVCVMAAGDCQIQTACSLVGLPEYINRYRSA
jgi:hypothetical protein